MQLTPLLLLLLHNSGLIKETAAAFLELLCTEAPLRGGGATERDKLKTTAVFMNRVAFMISVKQKHMFI